MSAPACTDQEFIELFEKLGPTGVAKKLGLAVRGVFLRRRNLEGILGVSIQSPLGPGGRSISPVERNRRIEVNIRDGVVLIGSDGHIWPGQRTSAMRGLVYFADWLKAKMICLNGDVIDLPKISRHDPIGWAHGPQVNEELNAVDEYLDELRSAAPERCERIWTWGNHDMRFDSALSKRVGEFKGVKGMSLPDHFPHWRFAISLWLNDQIVIKHRFKGGVHATHNNTLNAGKTMVTGHLHSLKVTPFDDYNGTRWGVDTGTLSQPNGEHADYAEDNPINHRSGFVVLTFKDGKLLWPEIVQSVDDQHVQFRGELIRV